MAGEIEALVRDPALRVALLPFAAALVAAGLLRLAAGPRFAAVGAALGAAVVWAEPLSGMALPLAPLERAAGLAALAVLAGIVLEIAGAGSTATRAAAALYALGAPLWLGWERLTGEMETAFILRLVVLWLAGVLILWRIEGASRAGRHGGSAVHAAILLFVAACAGAAVALSGPEGAFPAVFAGIAAALAAYLVIAAVNGVAGGRPLAFGPAGVLGIGGPWLAAAGATALFAGLAVWAATLLVAIFVIEGLGRRIARGESRVGRAAALLVYGAVVTLPAAAAAYVAMAAGP